MVKRTRPKWDLGRKVGLWLADQKAAGREPSTVQDLAREIRTDWGTVNGWIRRGQRPRSDILLRLARVMGADIVWLADDTKPYPPPDAVTALPILLEMLDEGEQRTLAEVLRDPVERRAWIASWSARRGRS